VWGKDAPRRFFGDAHWAEPLKWNQWAKDGTCYHCGGKRRRPDTLGRCEVCNGTGNIGPYRARVFCASMADVLERRTDLAPHRQRLWELIAQCDALDWLLLSKRPGNFKSMVPRAWMKEGGWPANVWPGTTVGVRPQVQLRLPALCKLPSLHKFISMEPLLADVVGAEGTDARELFTMFLASGFNMAPYTDVITWIIAGGESGGKARPSHPDWYRHIREVCAQYGVPFLFKQWGEWAPGENATSAVTRTEHTAEYYNGNWRFGTLTPRQSEELHVDDEPDVFRLGKKAAGRLLDGREWNEVPAPRTWSEAA
jgi:protein gp37